MVTRPDNTRALTSSVCERGQRIYHERLRTILGPAHLNNYVVVDVDTGEHEVDRDVIAAMDRAEAKRPRVLLYISRVGWNALGRIGGHTIVPSS